MFRRYLDIYTLNTFPILTFESVLLHGHGRTRACKPAENHCFVKADLQSLLLEILNDNPQLRKGRRKCLIGGKEFLMQVIICIQVQVCHCNIQRCKVPHHGTSYTGPYKW